MGSMIDGPSKVVDDPSKEHMTIFWSRVEFEKKPNNKHRNWVRWSHLCLESNSCKLVYLNLSADLQAWLKVARGLCNGQRPMW